MYYEAYVCSSLNITHTELMKQPYEWVNRMIEFLEAKNKATDFEYKKQSKVPKKKL